MRAILLAAGLGTRLRPLTETVPKCLVPIKGQPLLDIWLQNLTQAGVGPFLINTHYLPELVETYLKSSKYANQAKLAYEPHLLGTAGTLIANIDFFAGEDGLLIHADNYCLADFKKFIIAHQNRPSECLMTMMAFRTNNPSSCGIVDVDQRGVVIGFHEKVDSPPSNLANGAIYILSTELLNTLATKMRFVQDFSNEVIPEFIGKIYIYETDHTLIDVGTPDAYKSTNDIL
jgi:mannose-1-phosphate guanylyltransferase